MTFQHKTLQERWGKMSLAQQMGNIGSEVSRANFWHLKNDKEHTFNSVARALELIYFTVENLQNLKRSPALKEVLRIKEIIIDYFIGSNEYNTDVNILITYFNQFAMSAALRK